MKCYFIIVVIAMLSIKCANQKGLQKGILIEGIYVFEKKSIESTTGVLTLTQNRQFEYLYREGLAEYKTKGYYYVAEGNSLILNSDTSHISKNGIVKELYSQEKGKAVLKFLNPSNAPIKDLNVLLDGVLFRTDSIGEIQTTKPFKSIFSKFYTDFYFYYWNENNTSNNFTIQLFPNDNSEIYFINSKFEIRGKNLIDEEGRIYVKKKR